MKPIKPFNNRRHLTSRHRLRGFDYSTPGYYFITICLHNRQRLLGSVVDGKVQHTSAGKLVDNYLRNQTNLPSGIAVDTFVVMPDHVHVLYYVSLEAKDANISQIVQELKGRIRHEYAHGVRNLGWPAYNGKLWQEGFNDEFIFDDRHLGEVRRYIEENPLRWSLKHQL